MAALGAIIGIAFVALIGLILYRSAHGVARTWKLFASGRYPTRQLEPPDLRRFSREAGAQHGRLGARRRRRMPTASCSDSKASEVDELAESASPKSNAI